jgi:hypothetical protein
MQFLCTAWKVTAEFFVHYFYELQDSGGQAGESLFFESDILSVTGHQWTEIEKDKRAKASSLKAIFFRLPDITGQKLRRTSGRKPLL